MIPGTNRTRWARHRKHWWLVLLLAVAVVSLGKYVIAAATYGFLSITTPSLVMGMSMSWHEFAIKGVMSDWIETCVIAIIWVLLVEVGHRVRIRRHVCTMCDYDLRVAIELGRDECPECGCFIEGRR